MVRDIFFSSPNSYIVDMAASILNNTIRIILEYATA